MSLVQVVKDSIATDTGIRLTTALVRSNALEGMFFPGLSVTASPERGRVLVTAVLPSWQRCVRRIVWTDVGCAIEEALALSRPAPVEYGEWHLPWIDEITMERAIEHVFDTGPAEGFEYDHLMAAVQVVARQISISRCASMDFSHDVPIAVHVKNYEDILRKGRFDASEHQATPDERSYLRWKNAHYHGNLLGWQQCRKMIVGENLPHLQNSQQESSSYA